MDVVVTVHPLVFNNNMIINHHYVCSLLQSRITVSEKELLIVLIRLRVLASQSDLQFIHKYTHITCAQSINALNLAKEKLQSATMKPGVIFN